MKLEHIPEKIDPSLNLEQIREECLDLVKKRAYFSAGAAVIPVPFLDVVIDVGSMVILRGDGTRERLAARDFRLLQMLIERAPQVVSRDEILNTLWGEDQFPSSRTIDNAIVRLRQALGTTAGAFLRSVRSVGYQWDLEGASDE